MTHSGNPTHIEEAPEAAEREALCESAIAEEPTTLTGLGPVDAPALEEPSAELDAAAATLDALADTLLIRSRLRTTAAPPPSRAVRDYQAPTFLVPPPGSPPSEEPSALRSVWIEPEVTVVKPRSKLSDYAPAAARARHAAAAARAASRIGQSDAPWSTNSQSESPAAKASLRTPLIAFVASVVVTVALLFLVFLPKKGRLLVTAAGQGNVPIASAEVLVDGRRACASVPCRVDSLARGSHLVRVQAPGYERTADQAVAVQSGEDAVVHLNLASRSSAGIEVRAEQARGLRVTLDGSDRGLAPLTLRELSPGPHTLRLSGNPRYAPFEQELRLEPDQLARVEPTLVPNKAAISVTAGVAALGARVEIVGGGVRHDIRNLPARVEVSPDVTYQLRASRLGYRDYQTEISFADAVLEKNVVIDLVWDVAFATKPGDSSLAPSTLPDASAGSGILGGNSIPISSVLVDGVSMGTTPVRISVSPGPHSVVFVHPSLGRKSVSVQVSTGKAAVAAVRF